MDIKHFSTTQLDLLAAELAADLTATQELLSTLPPPTLAKNGLAILNLLPSSTRTGLGGKTILDLDYDSAVYGPKGAEVPTSSSGIRSGDIVRIEQQPAGSATKWVKTELKKGGVEGVVQRVNEKGISIVLGESDEEAVDKLLAEGKKLWVVKAGNEVVFRKMELAMRRLGEIAEAGQESRLMRVLFGHDAPSAVQEVEGLQFLDDGLNESQREAVRFALGSPDVALIHGPPGTGKTQTFIEVIRQLTGQGKRVLVCGPSNISVDNIVLRLPPSLPAVRIGHPARLLPNVLARSLEVLTRTSEEAQIVNDVRKEVDEKLGQLMMKGKGRLKGSARKEGWRDVRELRKEFRVREAKCVTDLVGRAKVVLATLHGGGARQLRDQKFDVVIIDEASQALEAQCWIPLMNASKLILAGDHLQLPPTVKTETNSRSDKSKSKSAKDTKPPEAPPASTSKYPPPTTLSTTLFSRLLAIYGPSIKRLLNTQYRMHTQIMTYPSVSLYNNELIAAPSVATHLLKDLPHVEDTDDTSVPLIFYDTQGGDYPESTDAPAAPGKKVNLLAESTSNPNEALLCAHHLRLLLDAGVKEEEIAIITPYSAQVSLLTNLIRSQHPAVEIGTVDGFQGREKEVVILSLVRSNDKGEIGFLGEKRRLNVAVTRARRCLVVIGDGETLSREKGWVKDWVAFMEENAEVRFTGLDEIQ
ncbi:DNA helicase [Ascobolus immersus RN42]|uniref:DNA helicase n=1 Tax=Ascobolus immersus RN42 TaxID=1160509 RepID=A0A3N4HEC4_ASCIM|nr:DNA helicase [Ascobolus immersus RN42]